MEDETIVPDESFDTQPEVEEFVEVEQPQTEPPAEEADWKARALKSEAILERQKKRREKPQEQPNPQAPDRMDRLELKIDGYSDSEIDFIIKHGGKAALENEFVKAAIESTRAKAEAARKAQDATPSGTNSPIYRKFSQADLNNMSVEELEKILPHAE